MSRKASKTKIANYDVGGMKVSSGGSSVKLTKNQGTIVEQGKTPQQALNLMPAPLLLEPANDHIIYGKELQLSWQPIKGAIHYRLEVATLPSFEKLVIVKPKLDATRLRLQDMKDGIYFWRVAGIDTHGFPGAKSQTRRFLVNFCQQRECARCNPRYNFCL